MAFFVSLAGFDLSAPDRAKLSTISGSPIPKVQRRPKCSAMNPRRGGASRNVTKLNCAKAATLMAAGRSVRCAAADMASGNIIALPAPIRANPTKATKGSGAKKTAITPSAMTVCIPRATRVGAKRSTNRSPKYRTMPCDRAAVATPIAPISGIATKTLSM